MQPTRDLTRMAKSVHYMISYTNVSNLELFIQNLAFMSRWVLNYGHHGLEMFNQIW